MAAECSSVRRSRWNCLHEDVLIQIFMLLSVGDLLRISHVCSSWRSACRDPSLWNKLELNVVLLPYHLRNLRSSAKIARLLNHALCLSRGNITTIVFRSSIRINDLHLVMAAARTPNLKRLFLSSSSHLSRDGMHRAIAMWTGLESLTITSPSRPFVLLEAIGKYCKNFSELIITCNLDLGLAWAIIRHVPSIKILSVHSSTANLKALALALRRLEHLEELNITNTLVIDRLDDTGEIELYKPAELPTIVDLSRLKRFANCNEEKCNLCKELEKYIN